ncbi:MAG: N-acetylmuramoyl-L-alanine amidase [Clostridiales bacterium]|jgi:N-acetylmuramoyl-L-alanine amidase|nr:N-acetylmuramoyl-L-alanine amidase [Eubacteriales bacterium]MDH7566993.1 N-acetylmuramoyl-L-alanine amidase [Clostridiales bacterium]
MIIVVRKYNAVLIALIFLLVFTLFMINIWDGKAFPAAKDQNMDRTVLLDPGHGGEDPGAVSDYSGVKEKDINLLIAMKVKELLERENYKVLMTRSEDVLQYTSDTGNIVQKRREDLQRRKKMMDSGDADIVVSIHLNKFPQTQYHGAQIFFPPDSVESRKLAMDIQKAIRETADPGNTREALVKKEPIIILKDSKTTTVIVECGFLSNPEEEKLLRTGEYQEKLALAIKNGIAAFFEERH